MLAALKAKKTQAAPEASHFFDILHGYLLLYRDARCILEPTAAQLRCHLPARRDPGKRRRVGTPQSLDTPNTLFQA